MTSNSAKVGMSRADKFLAIFCGSLCLLEFVLTFFTTPTRFSQASAWAMAMLMILMAVVLLKTIATQKETIALLRKMLP